MMERVFVYGILMREGGEPAVLADHRLRFYGFASAEEKPGGELYGMLLTVSDETFRDFDRVEGYRADDPAEGLYRRERVTVRLLDTGERQEAWVYKMNHGRWYTGPEAPLPGMVARMREVYEDNLMPVARLDEAVEETVDPFTRELARR